MANNSNRKAIEFMVQGALPPHSTNVLWMDTSVTELPVLKIFESGAWTNVHTEDRWGISPAKIDNKNLIDPNCQYGEVILGAD